MQTSLLKSLGEWSIARKLRLPYEHMERMNELWYLRQILDQLQVDCVVDVGANIGQYASDLRGVGYQGQIISIEPIKSVYATLTAAFSTDPKWRGYCMALGAGDDELTITVPRLTVMSSLLEADFEQKDTREESVSVRRLDALLPELRRELNFRRVFLKMDTQGYDLEVFKGSAGILKDVVGLQSELSVLPLYKNMPHYLESLQTYEAAGFELYNLSVVNRVSSGSLLELNCFMHRQ